jgi:hypothetical protein
VGKYVSGSAFMCACRLQGSFSLARCIKMHACCGQAHDGREWEGSWVEDANGPESGNGGRDGLGRARGVCLFRGGVLLRVSTW